MANARQIGPGRWEVRVYAGLDPLTGKRRYRSTVVHANTEKKALTAAADFTAKVTGGRHNAKTGMGFGALLDDYITMKEADLAPGTLTAYRWLINSWIKPALGNTKLGKLTARDLDALYAQARKKLSTASVNKMHVVIHGALEQARRWGFVYENVATLARPPSITRAPVRPPTTDELELLLSEPDLEWRAFMHVKVTTGARRGELCAVRIEDLDLPEHGEGIMRIAHNAHDDGSIGPTKSRRARVIVLDADTVEVLRRHLARCAEASVGCGAPLDGKRFVFSPRPGNTEPYNPKVITRRFARTCERLGIEGVRLHDLRHFTASHLLACGLDVRTVADRLGHARPSITTDIYGHAVGAGDVRAANIIGQLVRSTATERGQVTIGDALGAAE